MTGSTTPFVYRIILCGRAGIILFYSSLLSGFLAFNGAAQTFPNPVTLSTGQGAQGASDPVWSVSQLWYAAAPPNPMSLTYSPALINGNCAPGAWVDPGLLPPPTNNANWITGPDADCANNTGAGFRYFRLALNLPADCNGFSVTTQGSYVLSFDGYVDNTISDVYVNGVPEGISGGSYAAGSQLTFTLDGPWLVGTNYVDVCIYNTPNGGEPNPYGLLLVANTTTPVDTDNDGVENVDDLCPCDPGNNTFGCADPINPNNCDLEAIRAAFTTAGCEEMVSCVDDCSMYFLNPQSMSGSAAQSFAQNLGANLISIQSQAENDCIMTSLADMSASGVIWIGFNDETAENAFVWYDQSPVVYTNWAAGEPNNAGDEDCVQIYPDGLWNDLACGTANARSIIEVNLCPVVDAGPAISICNGETAPLAASDPLFGSQPYDFSWDNGVLVQPNPVQPSTTTEYQLEVTDRYACFTTDSVTVTVFAVPTLDSPNTDDEICAGESVTLNATSNSSLSWNNGIQNNVSFTPASTQTYTVTADNGNCSVSDNVTITVNAMPTVNAGIDQVICSGFPITLTATGTGTISWDNGIANGVAFTPSSTQTYTATAVSAQGCESTDMTVVTVNPLPQVNAGSDVMICEGEEVILTADGAAMYVWNPAVSNGVSFTPSVGTVNYTVTGTDANGCVNTDDITVETIPMPESVIGSASELIGNPGLTVVFTNNSTDAASYLWEYGNGQYLQTGSASSQQAVYTIPGTYSALLTAYNGICEDTSSLTVIVLPYDPVTVNIPNVFTPNADGSNDLFFLDVQNSISIEISIFNRWGELITELAGDEKWNGTVNGKPCSDGVYYFNYRIIGLDSQETTGHGYVELFR